MKRITGAILFLLLILVILHIVTLFALSNAQKRIRTLETKIEALQPAPAAPATAPAK